ncbi:hypothetical protein [Yersinia bercovieri]|uniref:hypothetical protein n=1 Tax=Yersinia bercovieri TaxID=634 RepID=UPI0005DAC570|nr:hypothetical protein [Yersinia bercovieri]MDN0104868.1 hypothetical protein [Yersinia bercovieri]CNJ00332.1 Uncharacterised protein [Yersinia bercovieri]
MRITTNLARLEPHGSTLSPSPSPSSSSFLSLSAAEDSDFDVFDYSECQLAKKPAISQLPITITNQPMPDGKKPSEYAGGKDRSLFDYLLNHVNSKGKPPLLLRPLAAFLTLFGIHGFGQTNCASCATAVAETFEKNVVHQAMPKLRGAGLMGIMNAPTQRDLSVSTLISTLEGLGKDDELNGVLAIHRPRRWQWLPGATQGHACNVIKYHNEDFIHFVDTQKKTNFEYHIDSIAEKHAEIRKFLGSIGDGGIDLYKKEFHADISKKAEASAPA